MPNFVLTTATRKIAALRKPIRLVAGGTSASKTVSILMCLIDYVYATRKPWTIDVVSETFPHLKAGAMADFKNIMADRGYWKDERWHGTDSVYTFETGATMHFFSADSPSKVHGPRRDILYINEGNNIPWTVADHMIVRTRHTVWVDWNPASTFWAYDELLNNPTGSYDCDFLTVTYRDNEGLDTITVSRIEAHRHNKTWWTVYGEGKLGEIEGRIYTGWIPTDGIPPGARLRKRGLDWGYTNDPTAIIDIYEYQGGFLLDEQLYAYNYGNERIADAIKTLPEPHTLVVADSSEPKSIDELRRYQISVLAANKGKDSIRQGISYIQDQVIYYTKRSIHLKREYERYVWLKDKLTDQYINEPPDVDNHLLDAMRYALESYHPAEFEEEQDEEYDGVRSLLY